MKYRENARGKGEVDRATYRCLEGHHDVSAEVYIFEHAFQLVCKLAAALCLQLGDHVLLCICTGAASQQQSLGQIFLVECLKDILALYVQMEQVMHSRCTSHDVCISHVLHTRQA